MAGKSPSMFIDFPIDAHGFGEFPSKPPWKNLWVRIDFPISHDFPALLSSSGPWRSCRGEPGPCSSVVPRWWQEACPWGRRWQFQGISKGFEYDRLCIYTIIYIYIYICTVYNIIIYIVIPPFNPGIFGGGVRQEISEKYFTWPREIYPPPRIFLGF